MVPAWPGPLGRVAAAKTSDPAEKADCSGSINRNEILDCSGCRADRALQTTVRPGPRKAQPKVARGVSWVLRRRTSWSTIRSPPVVMLAARSSPRRTGWPARTALRLRTNFARKRSATDQARSCSVDMEPRNARIDEPTVNRARGDYRAICRRDNRRLPTLRGRPDSIATAGEGELEHETRVVVSGDAGLPREQHRLLSGRSHLPLPPRLVWPVDLRRLLLGRSRLWWMRRVLRHRL